MNATDMERIATHLPVLREAANILQQIVENIHGVRPMPDGRVVFQIEADEALIDRLGEWGSTIEDDEDETCEHDERDLPKLAADGVSLVSPESVPEIPRRSEIPADLLMVIDRPTEIPAKMLEIIQRIAA